jgi:hypothetical protein
MPAGAHSNTTPRAESSSLVEKGGGQLKQADACMQAAAAMTGMLRDG